MVPISYSFLENECVDTVFFEKRKNILCARFLDRERVGIFVRDEWFLSESAVRSKKISEKNDFFSQRFRMC